MTILPDNEDHADFIRDEPDLCDVIRQEEESREGTTMQWKLSFDSHGFNDADDPCRRRLATLTTMHSREERNDFGSYVEHCVNTYPMLMKILEEVLIDFRHCKVCPTPQEAASIARSIQEALAVARGKSGV